MKQLLSIEWLKLKKLKSIKVIILIYLAIVPIWMYAISSWFELIGKDLPIPDTSVMWEFPTVWRFVTYSASFFNLLFCITIIILVANEFSYRTMRQNIIDGMDKRNVILSKFLVIVGLSTLAFLFASFVSLFFGMIQGKNIDLYSNTHYLFLYFFQTLCYFGFAFLITILIKRTAISIIVFIGYIFIEAIAGLFLPKQIYAFMPMNNFAKLTPNPFLDSFLKIELEHSNEKLFLLESWQIITLSAVFMVMCYVISYTILRRRDL